MPRPRRTSSTAAAALAGALAAALACTLVAGSPSAAGREDDRPPATARTGSDERVVWARNRDGIHLRPARTDGSGVRRVYDAPRGFTLELTIDPAGRRVAFSTCCRDRFPQLVVAPTRGGAVLDPLDRHRHLGAVGGIGWSPSGRRLAFEAISVRGEDRFEGIWTVRPDGRDLQLVTALPDPADAQPVINDALAWTPAGILYSDGTDLRAARDGRTRLVMRNVRSVRISGDHRTLVLDRFRGTRGSVWTARPDATGARRLLVQGEAGVGTSYWDVTPNHDASAFLAYRMRGSGETGLVTWRAGERPGGAAELPFTREHDYVATWR